MTDMISVSTVAAAALLGGTALTGIALGDDLHAVALAFLKRQGVPCFHVVHVDRPVQDFDLLATCHDGRRWALFFIEGEIAFVEPETGEPYRWRKEVFQSYPEVYGSPDRGPFTTCTTAARDSSGTRCCSEPGSNTREESP